MRIPAFSFLRHFWKTDVTVCIPAYKAGKFIDRTLRCALGQTYTRLRILVAVDRSTDDTADIVRNFSRSDPRIDVIEHPVRQGWCANVNSLLSRIETRFFFLYFHDDLILPQYCDRLRNALLQMPDAASAHCDMQVFGDRDAFRPGHDYCGPVAKRVLTLWGLPERGAPLRSMVRTSSIGEDYRLPHEEPGGFTPVQTLLIRLMLAGPAVRVPETLYLRWARQGGVTDGWSHLSFDRILRGWQCDVARAFTIIDEKIASPDDRHAIKVALVLSVLLRVSGRCRAENRSLPRPQELHPDAPQLEILPDFDLFGPEIAHHVRSMHTHVTRLRAALS
jgi:glycosyltransferase involved in cell wall biosynthesis